MPENPKPRAMHPRLLTGIGIGILLAGLGASYRFAAAPETDRGGAEARHASAATARAARAAIERLRWTDALRVALAGSPAFGAAETEAASPGGEVQRLLERFARQDPDAALAAVKSVTEDATARHKMAAIVVRAWAAIRPQEAWAWACASGEFWSCPDRPPLRCAALEGMAASAPAFLVQAVTAGAASTRDFDLITPATAALLHAGRVQQAADALLAWDRDLPAGAVGSVAVQLMVNELARRSPAEARAWLEQLPPSANRDAGETALAARWAETSPRDAVAWASGQASAQASGRALDVAFYAWSDRDPGAAIAWLAQAPAGPTADRLLGDLVSRPSFRAANPQQAVQLAESIQDEAARGKALKAAILTWSGFDHAAAMRYAQGAAGLTESQRAEIVGALQQHADFPSL